VTLPEVVAGELAGKFSEISLSNHHADFELESAYNSNSRLHGPSHASRLLSHRRRSPHPVSAPRVVPASSAGPAQRLPLRAGPARSPYPSTTRTSTPHPATLRTPTLSLSSTRILHTSSTSGRTLRIPSPRTTPLSIPCQGRPLGWL
jgi:hypothetical protein